MTTRARLANLKNFLASPCQEVQYSYTRNQLRSSRARLDQQPVPVERGHAGDQDYTSNGLNQYTAAVAPP